MNLIFAMVTAQIVRRILVIVTDVGIMGTGICVAAHAVVMAVLPDGATEINHFI